VKVLDDIHEKIGSTNQQLEALKNKIRQQDEKSQVFEENLTREFGTIRIELSNIVSVKDQLTSDRVQLLEYFDVFKKNTQEIITTLTKELSDMH
jgi:predicted  nucleic acid-binding Zn-ribbon protein